MKNIRICAVIIIIACILNMCTFTAFADNTIDYEQIYMDFAKNADTNYENPLQTTSGLIMADLNRDDVPELFSYSQSVTYYDIEANPIPFGSMNPDKVAYVGYTYWIEDAFSIVDGKVKVGTPWMNSVIHFPHLPDAVLYDYLGCFAPAQHGGAEDCLVISNPVAEGQQVYTVIKYDNGVFICSDAKTFDESFYDVYWFVDLPICSIGYSDDATKQTYTKSEAMETLLQKYSEKVENVNNTSDWAKENVKKAKEIGLMPQEMLYDDLSWNITREEFAGIAITLLEKITNREYQVRGGNPFEDVRNFRYYDYITKAFNASIVSGVSGTEFDPFAEITREQLATMLCRVIKSAGDENYTIENDSLYPLDITGTQSFADDAEISGYAKESVYYMNKLAITQGVGENRFAPQETATKEQAVAFALRI